MMKKLSLKNNVSVIIAMLINAFCSFFLVYFSKEEFLGIEFNFNTGHIIFTALSFICLTVIMQNRSSCLFKEDNIVRLTRIGSRRKALKIELIKIVFVVFLYEFIGDLFIFIFSLVLNKSFGSLAQMFILNYLIKLLLMIIQFAMDRVFSHNFGFMIISVMFITLLLIGSGIYAFCEKSSDNALISKLLFLNKLNLINYVSISRANFLTDKIIYPLLSAIGLISVVSAALFVKIKKINLLPKE